MARVDMSENDTMELLTFAKELAREAGEMIRKAFALVPMNDYDRKSATDPVTETDRAVEQFIFGRIRERFPSHKFIGEESASDGEWGNEATWIVDPIDGTANFVHRIPLCATSIGFTIDKHYVIGVIYNPILDEMFEATHMTSSKLNGKQIKVSQVRELTSACIASETGSDRSKEKLEWILDNLTAVLKNNTQCVRMMGSCALNMANVACGRVDVLYERGAHPWDMAAGVLIIRQAGGIVYGGGFHGTSDFELTDRSLFAFTPTLREELRLKMVEGWTTKKGNEIESN